MCWKWVCTYCSLKSRKTKREKKLKVKWVWPVTIVYPTDPCLFGGTCTNTNGSFVCTCQPEYTGHRCQYSTVCETQTPCSEGLSCVATVTNSLGYVCVEVNDTETIAVTGSGDMTTGALDDIVNNFEEMQSVSSFLSLYICLDCVMKIDLHTCLKKC